MHSDLEASRAVYDWVVEALRVARREREGPGAVREIRRRGASRSAARRRPRARSHAGAPNIERVDRLVQAIAAQKGMRSAALDEVVRLVDAKLESNRRKATDAGLKAAPAAAKKTA